MPIRDIALFGILAVGAPFMLLHPWIGVLYWVWFGLMNPHRLSWGLAYNFQLRHHRPADARRTVFHQG